MMSLEGRCGRKGVLFWVFLVGGEANGQDERKKPPKGKLPTFLPLKLSQLPKLG